MLALRVPMEGGWSVTEVELTPRGAIARVQMRTKPSLAKAQRAEARLDLGKLRFLDELPSNATRDPSAFATVVVQKLGEKLDAKSVTVPSRASTSPRHSKRASAARAKSIRVSTAR
jgi:hypothetical protein